MNMNSNPTADELHDIIAAADDNAGDHMAWVDTAGEVHLSTFDREDGEAYNRARNACIAKAQFYMPLFIGGRGYVGPNAAADMDWVAQEFEILARLWKVRARGLQDEEGEG